MPKSYLERVAEELILTNALPHPNPEFRFCVERRWRFDYAWPNPDCISYKNKVALEIEGGVWTKSRHTSGVGFTADCEKYNHAILDGWILIRVTKTHIINGDMIKWLKKGLGLDDAS